MQYETLSASQEDQEASMDFHENKSRIIGFVDKVKWSLTKSAPWVCGFFMIFYGIALPLSIESIPQKRICLIIIKIPNGNGIWNDLFYQLNWSLYDFGFVCSFHRLFLDFVAFWISPIEDLYVLNVNFSGSTLLTEVRSTYLSHVCCFTRGRGLGAIFSKGKYRTLGRLTW